MEDAWGSEGIDIDGDLLGGSVDCLSTEPPVEQEEKNENQTEISNLED